MENIFTFETNLKFCTFIYKSEFFIFFLQFLFFLVKLKFSFKNHFQTFPVIFTVFCLSFNKFKLNKNSVSVEMNGSFETFLFALEFLIFFSDSHGAAKERKIVALRVQKSRKEIEEFQNWKVNFF